MKTYNNLYKQLCSIENLESAYNKAKKRKSEKWYVIEFEKNLEENLKTLKYELETLTYQPRLLKRFIIRDPKTRTIHASAFRDRIVYHALVNILEPIFDKIFIHDSYASRRERGTHKAVLRFDEFKRKISNNGRLIKNAVDNNQVIGYILKADIKHYFDTVDHEILLNIIKRKIKDDNIIWLIKQILNNFDSEIKGKGMPLGNLTSQFSANVYLNDLDYFIKHKLKTKYYIRYVDDFVILHNDKKILEEYKEKVNNYLKTLKLELHLDKSKIIPLRNGIAFLGYRIFYHYKLLRKANIRKFEKMFKEELDFLESRNEEAYQELMKSLQGWFGYSTWANTFKYRNKIIREIIKKRNITS